MTDIELKEYDSLLTKGMNYQALTQTQKNRLNELGKKKIMAIKSGQIPEMPKTGQHKKKRKTRRRKDWDPVKAAVKNEFLRKLGLPDEADKK